MDSGGLSGRFTEPLSWNSWLATTMCFLLLAALLAASMISHTIARHSDWREEKTESTVIFALFSVFAAFCQQGKSVDYNDWSNNGNFNTYNDCQNLYYCYTLLNGSNLMFVTELLRLILIPGILQESHLAPLLFSPYTRVNKKITCVIGSLYMQNDNHRLWIFCSSDLFFLTLDENEIQHLIIPVLNLWQWPWTDK